MDVYVRLNNYPVSDMITVIGGLVNELDKAMKIKCSQSLSG